MAIISKFGSRGAVAASVLGGGIGVGGLAFTIQAFVFGIDQVIPVSIVFPFVIGAALCGVISHLIVKNRALLLAKVASAVRTAENMEAQFATRTTELGAQITERRFAEDELRMSEQRFRDFAISAADRFWETDAEYRMTFITEPVGKLVLPSASIVGKMPWEVDSHDIQNVDFDLMKSKFESRQPFKDLHLQRVNESGEQLYQRYSGVPVFDEAGEFQGYRGTISDETAEIEAKAESETLQRQLTDAIESIKDGVVLWDADDRFVMCNSYYRNTRTAAADMLVPGTAFADMLRALAEKSFLPSEPDKIDGWIAERMATRETMSYEMFREDRWNHVQRHRLEDGGVIEFHSDVTEMKAREKRLEQAIEEAEIANRAKTEFVANMGHELRTPLNAIIGFSDALGREVYGALNPKQAESVEDIRVSGHHLLELINDIFDMSVIEAGKLELNARRIDTAAAIEAAVRMVDARARSSGIEVANLVGENALALNADELRVKQIFVILLSNAVKFTPAGGRITVRWEKTDNGVAVMVADTGIGMDSNGIATALEMFGQVARNSAEHSGEGTGLGLPLAKRMIEAHGGALEIESQPNKGTTVRVLFPAEMVLG